MHAKWPSDCQRARQVITIGTPFAGSPDQHPCPVGLPAAQRQKTAVHQSLGPATRGPAQRAHHLDFQPQRWHRAVAGLRAARQSAACREHRSQRQSLRIGLEPRGFPDRSGPLAPSAWPVAAHGLTRGLRKTESPCKEVREQQENAPDALKSTVWLADARAVQVGQLRQTRGVHQLQPPPPPFGTCCGAATCAVFCLCGRGTDPTHRPGAAG
jgi:hypothetical protein